MRVIHSTVSLLVLLTLSLNAFAEVPHIFQKGMPAKASDVNENFAHLEGRIKAVEQGSSSSSGECDFYKTWGFKGKHDATSISYSAKASSAGDTIIAGIDYWRIVKFPFKEFGSGVNYTVKVPTREFSSNFISSNVGMLHVNATQLCESNMTISGFRSYVKISSEGRAIYLSNNNSQSYARDYVSVLVYVLVNETLLTFNIYSQIEKDSANLVPLGDFDFTDNLDVSKQTHDYTSLLADLDKLIDYIEISREP